MQISSATRTSGHFVFARFTWRHPRQLLPHSSCLPRPTARALQTTKASTFNLGSRLIPPHLAQLGKRYDKIFTPLLSDLTSVVWLPNLSHAADFLYNTRLALDAVLTRSLALPSHIAVCNPLTQLATTLLGGAVVKDGALEFNGADDSTVITGKPHLFSPAPSPLSFKRFSPRHISHRNLCGEFVLQSSHRFSHGQPPRNCISAPLQHSCRLA